MRRNIAMIGLAALLLGGCDSQEYEDKVNSIITEVEKKYKDNNTSQEEEQEVSAQQSVEAAFDLLNFESLRKNNLALDKIVADLYFAKDFAFGTGIRWSSTNDKYIDIDGKVERPFDGRDFPVNITATISKDGATIRKTFSFIVLSTDVVVENMKPRLEVQAPRNNKEFILEKLGPIALVFKANDMDGKISSARISISGETHTAQNVSKDHYQFVWTPKSFGFYSFISMVEDDKGEQVSKSSTFTLSKKVVVDDSKPVGSQFTSAYNDYCLALESTETLDGALVTSKSCIDGDKAYYWNLDTDGTLRTALNNDFCVTGVKTETYTRPSLQLCSSSDNQKWTYEDNAFKNKGSKQVLDLSRGNKNVYMWHYHGGENQQWFKNGMGSTVVVDNTDTTVDDNSNDDNSINANIDGMGWTEVKVSASGQYGTENFKVKSSQNWVNSGLYLKKGQSANITASGSWNVKGGTLYSANGNASVSNRGCQEGELTARIGLYYKDEVITCIGSSGKITAHQDGIVFVGATVSNDLGETYETRRDAKGSVNITVSSTGLTVPTIHKEEASSYDLSAVESPWVELRGDHTILTLPLETAKADQSKLKAAVQRIDDIYEQHVSLRGKTPYFGQAIRWFPDTSEAPGWMLAGNPVRMDPALVKKGGSSRITLAAEPDKNDWGFAHELGHNFNFAGGDWYYTTSGGLEAWPNIFSFHAIEKLGLPERELDCEERYQDSISKPYDKGLGGAWNGVCFLMEFKERYGWEFYEEFYKDFNNNPDSGWKFLRQKFDKAAGESTEDIFEKWRIPQN